MSHRIHEPNHAGECIFCGKYVGKDMNKTSSFVYIEDGDVNKSGGNDVTTKPTIRGVIK